MPGITLTVSGHTDPALSQRLALSISELACRVLDKEPERTTVFIHYLPHAQWFIGGKSLAELKNNAFRLQVTITDESCTKSQKIAFQKAAYLLLAEDIGNLHAHSNVHIIDCRAAAYGYGGVTQEARAYGA